MVKSQLYLDYFIMYSKTKNKHQIMNVHTKLMELFDTHSI